MENKILSEIKNMHSLKDLETLKESFNQGYNEWKEVLKLSEEAASAKTKSFGYVKGLIERNASAFLSKNPAILKEFINVVRNSDDLKNLYLLYENISQINENTDFPSLIQEWKKSVKPCTPEKLTEEKKKLEKVACEAYAHSDTWLRTEGNQEEKDQLYSLVESVFTMVPDSKNMAEYYNKLGAIKNIALKCNEAVNRGKEKTFESINSGNDGEPNEASFNESKNRCLRILSEAKKGFSENGDNESASKIDEYINSVSAKSYNKETVYDDMNNLNNLAECFF